MAFMTETAERLMMERERSVVGHPKVRITREDAIKFLRDRLESARRSLTFAQQMPVNHDAAAARSEGQAQEVVDQTIAELVVLMHPEIELKTDIDLTTKYWVCGTCKGKAPYLDVASLIEYRCLS